MRRPAPKHVIHWFSPLPPARTDIAEYTRRILPALRRKAQVILWSDQGSWDQSLEAHAIVRRYDPDTFSPACIARARRALGIAPHLTDAVFTNIGNNWQFHAGLLRVTQRVPSVVVLHDLVLQEMLLDSVRNGALDGPAYLDAVDQTYGSVARSRAQEALSGNPEARQDMLAFPGLELVTRTAMGILAHSHAASRYFLHAPPTDPMILNLPFPSPETATTRRVRSGPVRLLQFGHIGPNRRAIEILDVLGSLQDRLAFRFDIIGQVWDNDLLKRKIDACGLQGSVHLHGHVPEIRLDDMISQAHLVFNLRAPTMGEASGSQLRIWSRAGCSVVSDHGWYASLPDSTVLKIPVTPEAERDSLRRVLLDLGHDSENSRARFGAVGTAGLARLKSAHDPESYADEICKICDGISDMAREFLLRRQT
jgi:glycosyltransferase involved in cell wall biosynthesis